MEKNINLIDANSGELVPNYSNEFKIKCTNGYTVENIKIEGNTILIECFKKHLNPEKLEREKNAQDIR